MRASYSILQLSKSNEHLFLIMDKIDETRLTEKDTVRKNKLQGPLRQAKCGVPQWAVALLLVFLAPWLIEYGQDC